MTAIRLLALDVDGTLTARGNEVTAPTRDALHRLHDAGIEIVISTGRRYRTTRVVIEALGLDVAAVCLGGALVKERDSTTLAHSPFPARAFREIAGFLRERGHVAVAQRDAHLEGGADFLIDGALPWDRYVSAYQRGNAEHAEWVRDLAADPRDDVLVLGTFGERTPLEGLAAAIERAFPGRFAIHVMDGFNNEGCYCEITPRYVSKWSGLLHFAEARGVGGAAICAVGDQSNDLAMIRGAGMGVAMGNAIEPVKEAADWITGPNDADGLVAVVERLLESDVD